MEKIIVHLEYEYNIFFTNLRLNEQNAQIVYENSAKYIKK